MSAPATVLQLTRSGRPLGVWCHGCGHAALLTAAQLRVAERSEMDSLCQIRLRCALCGSHDWRGMIFNADEQMKAWLSAPFEPAQIVAVTRP